MTLYISIDGDDIGNKIAIGYLENDEDKLARIHHELNTIVYQLCEHLKLAGFQIIFCAADGIVCKGQSLDLASFVQYIKKAGQPHYTFSVGIGNDLRSSFFALKYAKAIGKDKTVIREQSSEFSVIEATL